MRHSPVEQIKERLSIDEVVGSYVTLTQSGKNLRARCPFHNENTPSFFVSPDRGTYYCFGCGAKGDIFSFVEAFEGLDFQGALRLLAQRAGVTLQPISKKVRDRYEQLYRVLEAATVWFEQQLDVQSEAQSYLTKRGVDEKTWKQFRVGYASDAWRELAAVLQKQGFSEHVLLEAGLIKKPDGSDKRPYDRFRGRIMFPITDSSNRVIAFSGRIFPEQEGAPKYLNSPDTPLFDKQHTLFGLSLAKPSIRTYDFTVLVEGQLDVLLAHQIGYRNTVALSGTALASTIVTQDRPNHLGIVKRLSRNLVIAFDSDEAGTKAALRNARIALSLGMEVKIARLPSGKDPADLISAGEVETWKQCIRGAMHGIDFQVKEIVDRTSDRRERGRLIRETVLPLLADVPSAIEKSHFVGKIRDAVGIPEEAIWEDLNQLNEHTQPTEQVLSNGENPLQRKTVHRTLAALLYRIEKDGNADLRAQLDNMSRAVLDENVLQNLYDEYQTERDTLLFEADVLQAETNLEAIAIELTTTFLRASLRQKLRDLSEEIRQLEQQDGDSEPVLRLYKTYAERLQHLEEQQ